MRYDTFNLVVTSSYHSPQISTENERKSLQAQINNERMVSSDQKRTYEKKIEMLRKQIDDFEVEKKELFIEKVSTLHSCQILDLINADMHQYLTIPVCHDPISHRISLPEKGNS